MKKFTIPLLVIITLVLNSCGEDHSHRQYWMSENGLIYKYGSDELFSGVVIDTADVIITFEVVNGIKNGAFITFYHNGEYEKYGLIENDMNVGEWRYFYPNGQLECKGSFTDNKASGTWTYYYPDGKIKMEGSYSEGLQHGKWFYYNRDRKIINVFHFQNGIMVDYQTRI